MLAIWEANFAGRFMGARVCFVAMNDVINTITFLKKWMNEWCD